jgi:hypothetical protein
MTKLHDTKNNSRGENTSEKFKFIKLVHATSHRDRKETTVKKQKKKTGKPEKEANPTRVCGSKDEYLETSAVYIARFWYCKQEN